jgi:hypothetical protein
MIARPPKIKIEHYYLCAASLGFPGLAVFFYATIF